MKTVPDLRRLLIATGVVTAGVVVVSTVSAGLPSDRTAAGAVLVLTAAALALWALALNRRVSDARLLTVALTAMGLIGAVLDLLRPSGPGFVLAYMAMAAIGLRLPRRNALIAGSVVVLAAGYAEGATSDHPVSAALTLAAGAAALFLASAFAGVSRDAHAQAEELLVQQAVTRAAQQEAAVLGERQRLARELHDVLAHTLSGLALRLEGARLLAERTGADARLAEQVAIAAQLARDGMAGAKRAVSTLRGEALPGAADLPALIEQTRLSGLPISYNVVGKARPLPGDAGLAVYRAVQEALTNTAKHAGAGATASVTLTWGDTELVTEVADVGGDRVDAHLPSGGYGLAGLTERAALAGGQLIAGPTTDGWRVELTLPLSNPDGVTPAAAGRPGTGTGDPLAPVRADENRARSGKATS